MFPVTDSVPWWKVSPVQHYGHHKKKVLYQRPLQKHTSVRIDNVHTFIRQFFMGTVVMPPFQRSKVKKVSINKNT